jgi:hypothetical protein
LGQTPATARLDVLVKDDGAHPLVGSRVELEPADDPRGVKSGETDALGHLLFANLRPGRYRLTVKQSGFETFIKTDVELPEPVLELVVTMTPTVKRSDNIEVRGTFASVESSSSVPNTLPAKTARELPSRPATVADALPLTPGVIREPSGALILSSSPENRSALIVNSADVTDPGTGQFGLTVPIDSVEVLNVYQTAYLAEYGRFTSGLVSVETKRGGDKWKWELNDPLPEFRIRSWHLLGLKTATPRVNFEGPLIANKLFLSEGSEYEYRKTAVYTLPFPDNQKVQQGVNTFTQLDWVASNNHLVTATIHIAPQRLDSPTLDFFNPLPTTPYTKDRNYTGTTFDRLTLWRGTLENRFSVTEFDAASWGKGTQDLVISPIGNSGNYFADQNRTASRISGSSLYELAPIKWAGTHQLKFGGYVAHSEQSGSVLERPIDVVDITGLLLMRMTFPFQHRFDISDLEKAFFGEDHWGLARNFSIDLGVRTEAQQISGALRVAPRVGFAWTPWSRSKTVFRGGAGLFYDRVPLNVYGFNRYPSRVVTFYDATGAISAGPFVFVNTLGQNRVRFPFVRQNPTDGNFSPTSTVWNVQMEQTLTQKFKFRATYLYNDSTGLVVLNTVPPDPTTNIGALLLEGTGQSRYRQFDVTAQLRLRDDRELFFSYVHSLARGDLNDFGRFLGTIPAAIIRGNEYGKLATDMPNRFLMWGVIRLPRKLQIAPILEYRNGFPYLETDALQQYVGVPYRNRFPNFLSLDSRFSKDLKVNAKYSVRVSISGFNLTSHFNPEAVHGNTADPLYGYFFGNRGRHFTMDMDFLF